MTDGGGVQAVLPSTAIVERPVNTVLGSRIPGWVLDFGPAAFIGFVGLVAIHRGPGPTHPAWAYVALAAAVVAVAIRHRSPIGTLAVILVAAAVVDYKPIAILPVMVGLFTVVEYSARWRMIQAVVVSTAVVLSIPLFHDDHLALPGVLSRLVAIGLAVAAGLWLRARADFIAGVRDRATRVERERELLAGQAVAEERVRIARELHDVVAHNVSLMVVQAQALAATDATTDEAERKEALGRVAGLGREALSEMHRMLGVLRLDPGEAPELHPQPGVREIESLVERARGAGLRTRMTVEGQPRELPQGVELSAFRIVQEALTNVIRHASATAVEVTLTYAAAGLDVAVTDDGIGPPVLVAAAGDGHGLVGMRERAALFGGELEAGAAPSGRGYRVHALLPV